MSAQSIVPPIGRLGELEDEVVPGALELGMILVELDQLGEGLRIGSPVTGFVPST